MGPTILQKGDWEKSMKTAMPGRGYGRTARMLSEIAEHTEGLSATELAARLQTPKSTVLLMLRHFREIGFVRQEGGRIKVGPALVRLAFRVIDGFSVRDYARRHLEELARSQNESIYLAVLSGTSVINVERFGSSDEAHFSAPLGAPRPLYATSAGKVFLAFGPDTLLEDLFREGDPVAITERTITSQSDLKKEIAKIRRQGYAVNDGEFINGVYALGAPIFHQGKVIAAITISDIRPRAIKQRDRRLTLLADARARIERDLEGIR